MREDFVKTLLSQKRMDIVNSLKSGFGEVETAKLSQFLGENIDSVENSLDLTFTAMLRGLKEIVAKEGDAAGIMKVISDGGHSGDLTNDLASLFNNSDKIRLLITIGKNINNYFFKNKVNGLVDRISSHGKISKTSASSLLSLSAPLVLGALGKNIKLEGLDLDSFTRHLLNDSLEENNQIEDNLAASFQSTYTKPLSIEKSILKAATDQFKKKKSKNAINGFAWLILGLLGLTVAFYTLKDKNLIATDNWEDVESLEITTKNKNEEDISDDLNTEKNKNPVSKTKENSAIIEPKKEGLVLNQEKEEIPNVVKNTSSESSINNNRAKSSITNVEPENNSRSSAIVTSDNRPMSVKLNQSNSFFGINGFSFKNNSAEIMNRGSLNLLVQYLKNNPTRKIQIAGTGTSGSLAEDRAFGLQGVLFELGVDVSQTEIMKFLTSDDGPVVVKIK